MDGFENTDLALHMVLCLGSASAIRLLRNLPNFDIASDAAATFKELLTRHKSTVAEFLTKNEDWFFADYNSMCVFVCYSR
ncbi:hypothetical protein YC2023_099964 [Brassica napus]